MQKNDPIGLPESDKNPNPPKNLRLRPQNAVHYTSHVHNRPIMNISTIFGNVHLSCILLFSLRNLNVFPMVAAAIAHMGA